MALLGFFMQVVLFLLFPIVVTLVLMDWKYPRKKRMLGKAFFNVLMLVVVELLALAGALFFIFDLHAGIFMSCVIAFGGLIGIYLTLLLWKRKWKVVKIVLFILMIACLATFFSVKAYQYYVDQLPTVGEWDGIIYEYQPFEENTKAVTLEEESIFKIEDNLPVLDGATALYPVYASLAQNVYPSNDSYPPSQPPVQCKKTPQAYEQLTQGQVDMIFVAEPSRKQLEAAAASGVEFQMTPIGKEAFVFFVNKDNPVDSLTLEQIQGIYNGTYTNWKELGGKNQKIQAFQRDEGSGSQTALQKIMGGQEMISPVMTKEVGGMGGIIEKVGDYKNYSNAIGFSFRFYSTEMVKNDEIKLVKINGVAPTEENIRNGSYPISSYFYAITAGSQNPNIQPFLDWILSEQGQEIIEKVGYTPMQ